MGKRLIQQRRGKGSSTYRVPEQSFKPKITYVDKPGKVVDFVDYRLLSAPLAKVKYEDNSISYVIAPEGLAVGDAIDTVVKPVGELKEGTKIFGLETYPYSGPKLCRSSGSAATLVSKAGNRCVISLPSKKTKTLHSTCRVTVGIPAGEGVKEKPLMKAGKMYHKKKVKGKLYPRTSGSAMNAVSHPFGASGSGKVRPPVARGTPPGRKVGSLWPKRTGKRK